MTTVTPLVVGYAKDASFFVRCDSRRSTAGGCFPQTSLSAANRVQLCESGDFAEPFPPPLRPLFWARRSALGRAPQRAARPLIPGRARPAPALLHPLWRSRAYASNAALQKKKAGKVFSFFRETEKRNNYIRSNKRMPSPGDKKPPERLNSGGRKAKSGCPRNLNVKTERLISRGIAQESTPRDGWSSADFRETAVDIHASPISADDSHIANAYIANAYKHQLPQG